jgi:sulfate adenylyltransferase large subunit
MLTADPSPIETPIVPLDDNVDAQIELELEADRTKNLLRFSTAGSVDDGKSTLIGRLLYDSRNVYDDHIRSVTHNAAIDFAQLTDGLRAEREQGITIDVAYRYFSTPKRKFIIADTPGHEQYTRNMATGASTADVAIVLVDARKGILDQTRRHTCIAALLGIPTVIAAINKMDLVDFSQDVFDRHRRALEALATRLEIPELIAVPVSALEGDNIVHRSRRISWYSGPSLLELLEIVPLAIERSQAGFRFPVQRVLRPHQDFRGFAGQIAAGTVQPGDEIVALPSGHRTRVRAINTWEGDLASAHAPQSVVLTLEDEIDLSRGDMIASVAAPPHEMTRFNATVVWMHLKPLRAGASYLLKHTTQTVRAQIVEIRSRIDVEHLEERPADQLALNDIGEVVVEVSRSILADPYRDNRTTGSFILIDLADNATSGAAMIRNAQIQDHVAGAENRCDFAVAEEIPVGAQPTGALLELGARSQLAAELEKSLLEVRALVLRTRVPAYSTLLTVARSGAVVLIESDTNDPITLSTTGAQDKAPRILATEDPADILAELRRLKIIPSGDQPDASPAQ